MVIRKSWSVMRPNEPSIKKPTNISAGAMMFVLCMMRKPMPLSVASISAATTPMKEKPSASRVPDRGRSDLDSNQLQHDVLVVPSNGLEIIERVADSFVETTTCFL